MAKINISGVDLEIEERGSGPPLLFLHAGEGLWPDRPWLDLLAKNFRVVAPHHPGWGGSVFPDWLGSVDDLAYLYLDLARQINLKDAVLVGNCFGGWIAAEMAVRNTDSFAKFIESITVRGNAGQIDFVRTVQGEDNWQELTFLHDATEPASGATAEPATEDLD